MFRKWLSTISGFLGACTRVRAVIWGGFFFFSIIVMGNVNVILPVYLVRFKWRGFCLGKRRPIVLGIIFLKGMGMGWVFCLGGVYREGRGEF